MWQVAGAQPGRMLCITEKKKMIHDLARDIMERRGLKKKFLKKEWADATLEIQ